MGWPTGGWGLGGGGGQHAILPSFPEIKRIWAAGRGVGGGGLDPPMALMGKSCVSDSVVQIFVFRIESGKSAFTDLRHKHEHSNFPKRNDAQLPK